MIHVIHMPVVARSWCALRGCWANPGDDVPGMYLAQYLTKVDANKPGALDWCGADDPWAAAALAVGKAMDRVRVADRVIVGYHGPKGESA